MFSLVYSVDWLSFPLLTYIALKSSAAVKIMKDSPLVSVVTHLFWMRRLRQGVLTVLPVLGVDTLQPEEAGELYEDLEEDSGQTHQRSEYQ